VKASSVAIVCLLLAGCGHSVPEEVTVEEAPTGPEPVDAQVADAVADAAVDRVVARDPVGCPRATLDAGAFADTIGLPQTGWAPQAPKHAVVSLGAHIDPPTFRVTSQGRTVLSGTATYVGKKYARELYVADLSSVAAPGIYQIGIDGVAPACFEIAPDAYARVRGPAGLVSVGAMVRSFFGWQRCQASQCVPKRHPSDYMNLPQWELIGGTNSPEHALSGTSGDMRGGWHDATSSDKETGDIARALASFAYALPLVQNDEDRSALTDEIVWGADYLVRIQSPDGSFPIAAKPLEVWDPVPKRPMRELVNVDTGIVARATASLAAASEAIRDVNPAAAESYLSAARSGYGYVTLHPDGFLPSDYYPSYWRGSAGSIVGANVELARATGEQAYVDAASALIGAATLQYGAWQSQNGTFPGEYGSDQEEGSHTVVYLMRFYEKAPAEAKTAIRARVAEWLDHWKESQVSAYGITDAHIVPWFGGDGALVLLAEGLLMVGDVLGDRAAAEMGLREVEWTVGANPYAASFVWGVGRDFIVEPFSRPGVSSIGAVLPGPVTTSGTDDTLTIAPYYDPSITWSITEATIDSTGALTHVLPILHKIYGQ
jgi:hypothetical protein